MSKFTKAVGVRSRTGSPGSQTGRKESWADMLGPEEVWMVTGWHGVADTDMDPANWAADTVPSQAEMLCLLRNNTPLKTNWPVMGRWPTAGGSRPSLLSG